MFFIRFGNVVAWVALAVSAYRIVAGVVVAVAAETPESLEWMSRRYLGATSSGQAIDEGLKLAIIAIVLGILAAIGRSIVLKR